MTFVYKVNLHLVDTDKVSWYSCFCSILHVILITFLMPNNEAKCFRFLQK